MTPIIIDDESICMLICINNSHLSDISFSHFHVTHENLIALSFHSNCERCTTMQHAFTSKLYLHIKKKLTAICNFHPSHELSFRWELQLAFALPRAAEAPIELRWAPPISKSWEWTGEMKRRLITLLTLSRNSQTGYIMLNCELFFEISIKQHWTYDLHLCLWSVYKWRYFWYFTEKRRAVTSGHVREIFNCAVELSRTSRIYNEKIIVRQ